MKFRAIVEYEYPIEHKPPVKAELILHGDRVVTDSIEPLPQEPFINKPCVSSGVCEHDKNKVLDKIRAEIDNALSDGMIHKKTVLGIIDKYKAEGSEV